MALERSSKFLHRALALVTIGCVVTGSLTIAGCATAAPIDVYRALGTKQCEVGGPKLADARRMLEAAGVVVRGESCGRDGRMHPAMCGAGDGRIAIFVIDARDLARARAQGFATLADAPQARREACELERLPQPPDENRRQ